MIPAMMYSQQDPLGGVHDCPVHALLQVGICRTVTLQHADGQCHDRWDIPRSPNISCPTRCTLIQVLVVSYGVI